MGKMPLDLAASGYRQTVAQILLENGANIAMIENSFWNGSPESVGKRSRRWRRLFRQ
jgi:hypothetical protein